MKNLAIMISIMLLGVSNINLIANPSTDNKIEVCEEVDIRRIASILGWNESEIESESMVSSSNQRNGVCRYVHKNEDLVIIVKEINKSQEKGGTYRAFGTVSDGRSNDSAKQTYELKKNVGKYHVELNYGTEKDFADVHALLEKITLLIKN